MLSSLYGDSEIVELLLRNGAEPNAFTDAEVMERQDGCSTTNALMLATGNGRIETVRLLLEYGANPLLKNNADMCALFSARRHLLRGHKATEIQQILSMFEASEFMLDADKSA